MRYDGMDARAILYLSCGISDNGSPRCPPEFGNQLAPTPDCIRNGKVCPHLTMTTIFKPPQQEKDFEMPKPKS